MIENEKQGKNEKLKKISLRLNTVENMDRSQQRLTRMYANGEIDATTYRNLTYGINKQLDLQMLLADLGRTYAKSYAWYTQRRPVQIQAVSISLALCLGLVEIVLFKLRQRSKITWLALFGLMILALYFGLRLVSLHHVDKYLMISCRGMTVGNLIEIGGILFVSLSALLYYYAYRQSQAQYILR